MLPIKDSVIAKNSPVAMWWIIAANVAVYFGESNLSESQLEGLFMTFGAVPERFTPIQPLAIGTLFTNMFLHGSLGHLIGNMWTLYLFGDNVEDRMGSGRFTAFYLLCGLIATITHVMTNPGSPVPAVGASGAISGVMGAYLIMYPKANIVVMIPLLLWPFFINIASWVYLGGWFLIQYWNGTSTAAEGSGVAFWAHIGGFVAGVILFSLFLKPKDQRCGPRADECHWERAWG